MTHYCPSLEYLKPEQALGIETLGVKLSKSFFFTIEIYEILESTLMRLKEIPISYHYFEKTSLLGNKMSYINRFY